MLVVSYGDGYLIMRKENVKSCNIVLEYPGSVLPPTSSSKLY